MAYVDDMQYPHLPSLSLCSSLVTNTARSLRNPFTSYKKKYPRYHCLAWGIGFLSAVTLGQQGLAGTSTADICWVKDESSTDVWTRNKQAILFLYMWMCLYFFASIVVFVVAICRINGGLKSTYQVRMRRHLRT